MRDSIRRITQYPISLPTETPFQDLVTFTYGSRRQASPDSKPLVGRELALQQAGRFLLNKTVALNPSLIIFEAEVTAVIFTVDAALSLLVARLDNNL